MDADSHLPFRMFSVFRGKSGILNHEVHEEHEKIEALRTQRTPNESHISKASPQRGAERHEAARGRPRRDAREGRGEAVDRRGLKMRRGAYTQIAECFFAIT